MTLCTQTQLAGHLGKDKSYVTRLKQAGRLVLGEGGQVDLELSLRRIADTAGGRDDVAARHAAARSDQAAGRPEMPKGAETRVSAQTRKEMAQADLAEMERDVMRGRLIEREQVEQALADLVSFARQGMENLPHRVAAQLVGKDFDQIMATLRQEVVAMMTDTHKEAGKRLAELTKGEGA
jgi:phage terminase Nu1 subunit (DNA packaging protein)